jgi:hypothetical protein
MTAKTEVLKLVPLRSIDDRKLPRMEDGKEWPSPSIQRSSKLKFEATTTYTSPSWVFSELAILCLGKAIGLIRFQHRGFRCVPLSYKLV